MPNSNDMSDFTCQCTDTMLATCTSSFASAYLCVAVVAIAVALARVCTCDWSDDSDSDDDETSEVMPVVYRDVVGDVRLVDDRIVRPQHCRQVLVESRW